MAIKFRSSADKHHVPRRSSIRVVLTSRGETVITNWGEAGLQYIGTDENGEELEIITVQRGPDEVIVHAMPTSHRHQKGNRS